MYIYPDMVIIDCVPYRFSNHGVNMISLDVILVEFLMYSIEFLMIVLEVLYPDGSHAWIVRDNCG